MISGSRYRLTLDIERQSRLAADIARAQAEIATGKRILTPSDDPAAQARVATIRRAADDNAAWKANISAAAAQASLVDDTLTAVATSLDRARELVLAARNGTYSAADRAAAATELRGIVADLEVDAAAQDSQGQPLFPAADALAIPIGDGVQVAATASRARIFEGVPLAAGPADLIRIVRDAADALEMGDPTLRGAAIGQAIGDLAIAVDHVSNERGAQGVRAARLDGAAERLAAEDERNEEERGTLEGTDIPATVARLNARQLSLEAAQAVFTRVNSRTLFDLLG